LKVIVTSTKTHLRVFGSLSALAESLHADGTSDECIAAAADALRGGQSFGRDDFTAQVAEIVTWNRRPEDSLPNTIFHGGKTYVVPAKSEFDEWADSGIAKSLDGCEVEPNGECQHGLKSWYVVLQLL
jgi:hypothetical protein